MSELRARIARASKAQGVMSLLGKALNLVSAIVLARLLFPEDYGLFAIALIVTGLANLFSHFGFQSYIIQAPKLTSDQINTCYTLNVAFAALLGGGMAALGALWVNPPPLLPQMLMLYGLHVFLSGLTYIELALLRRELDFARSSRVDLTYTIVSTSGRIAFAATGFGALCFPLGDLLGSTIRWIMMRRARPAKLRLIVPRGDEAREALHFGMHSTSVGIASFVANQTDKMLLSATLPVAAVGLYSFASNTAAVFYNAFIVPQTTVFLATFARLRDDLPAAREVLAVASRLILSFALPVNVLLLLEPRRILEAVFGAQWLPAAVVVQVFAVDYIVRAVFSGVTGLQMSFGKAAAAARTKWTNAVVFVCFLSVAAAMKVGIVGYAVAYVGANMVATLHNLHVNAPLIEIRWGAYVRNLLPPIAIALVSTAAWAYVRQYAEPFSLWPALGITAGTWLLTYAILSLAFNRVIFKTLRGLLARERSA